MTIVNNGGTQLKSRIEGGWKSCQETIFFLLFFFPDHFIVYYVIAIDSIKLCDIDIEP
jgi:hypothetical protein